tara:strand:- start:1417 stop:2127 length:711 start_codon:yes stop_codon:yes gene_type:complete
MTTIKTLDSTILGNTPSQIKSMSETSTAKSVLEKLKTLSEKTSKAAGELTKGTLDRIETSKIGEESSNIMSLIFRYGLAFLLVTFLLVNILSSLGILPTILKDFFNPILLFFRKSIGETIRETSDNTETGAKEIIDITSKSVDGAVDILEDNINPQKEKLRKQLNHPENNLTEKKEPEPDDSSSKTQIHRGSGKSGYCYIGEDRGFRSCIEVKDDDKCMSGDIFPTRDICINPTLR